MTIDLTDTAYTGGEREIISSAYDEAWGALKGWHHKIGGNWTADDAEQDRKMLADAIYDTFFPGIDCGDLAEKALERLGHTPARSIYSLEIAA